MKRMIVVAALMSGLAAPLCRAQVAPSPKLPATVPNTLISMRFDKTSVEDLAKMIADHADVDLILEVAIDPEKRLSFEVKDVAPAVALEKLAAAAGLKLTKVNVRTFLLAAQAQTALAPTQPQESPVETNPIKPYTIKLALPENVNLEIGVQATDSFDVVANVSGRRLRVRGHNALQDDKTMRITISILNRQLTTLGLVQRQALSTTANFKTDGQLSPLGGLTADGKTTTIKASIAPTPIETSIE